MFGVGCERVKLLTISPPIYAAQSLAQERNDEETSQPTPPVSGRTSAAEKPNDSVSPSECSAEFVLQPTEGEYLPLFFSKESAAAECVAPEGLLEVEEAALCELSRALRSKLSHAFHCLLRAARLRRRAKRQSPAAAGEAGAAEDSSSTLEAKGTKRDCRGGPRVQSEGAVGKASPEASAPGEAKAETNPTPGPSGACGGGSEGGELKAKEPSRGGEEEVVRVEIQDLLQVYGQTPSFLGQHLCFFPSGEPFAGGG